ncbi:MAG: RluA family pseudouridine synthase [Clostridia bacterium]|nr:RluA family pseudouridine synthase [Clostridia bacterium]NCD02643.1 RluA family pseudouridine synthase [Clostridia bacterium]
MMNKWIVAAEENNIRIDRFISDKMPDTSRSYIQKLMKEDLITADLRPVKANYKVREGESIEITLPEPVSLDIEAQDMKLDIIYEDDDVLLVNKPKDMVVHPSAGHSEGTLVNGLLYHCKDSLSSINGVMRPGIVHRIDKDTTGVLIICKNDKSHSSIAEQLKVHSITRRYHAIVWNNIVQDSGTVDAPIGRHSVDRKKMAVNYKNGKSAITHFKVLERFGQYTYIECELETGRTHQIRVHMASIGHPLLGDLVYGPARQPFKLQGQVLHAKVLGFVHPTTGEYMEFETPLPEYFEKLLERLRNL